MKTRSIAAFASVAALLTLGLSAAAQAQPVYWSVGLSSPGVQVRFGATPPVVWVQPGYQPVYVAPPRVVYVRPAPVVLQPVPQYIRADWRYGAHRHGWEERRDRQERREDQHNNRGEHDRRG